MELAQAVEQRRAVKAYDPAHKMSDEEIETLMETALKSPTSFNIQNWRFVLVQDEDKRKALRAAAWDQPQVTDASLIFVLCADLKAWDREPARYWKNTPQETQEVIVPMIKQFYHGRDQVQRDEAMRSVGIAAQTMMLTAKSMGYDSCPMIGFDPDAVADIINLPEDHVVGMMLAVGKAAKPANPRGGQLPLADVLFTDGF
ncbi:MAG: nitroreductase family protein [Alphaproteobacteria bacterium]|jgi:nitroreductase|nr:nitroreductase family protein [Alphaproteobacteria bacterium]MDP7222381.1 nitroreductase family protein [Alphaproteobacteria bacterium]